MNTEKTSLETQNQPSCLGTVSGSLSKSEKQVIKLLEKIDEIANKKDFKAYIFGQAGYFAVLLKNPTPKQIEIESKQRLILNERVIWMSKNIRGDGAHADFRWLNELNS